MKRFLGHALVSLLLLGGAGAVVAACAHDNSSVFVADVLAPQYVTSGNICVFTGQTTQATLSKGVLDVALLQEYNPVYLVGNQLVPQVNSQQLQTETSTVQITSAAVRITDSSGNNLNSFTVMASATIFPSSGGVPTFEPIQVLTIDEGTIAANDDIQNKVVNQPFMHSGIVRLITYVKFYGQTLGGDNVETGEFPFPVDVCQGCLIQFSSTDVQAGCPAPNCNNAGASSTTVSSPCTIGQDVPVDCSLCLGRSPDCSGVPQPAGVCSVGDAG